MIKSKREGDVNIASPFFCLLQWQIKKIRIFGTLNGKVLNYEPFCIVYERTNKLKYNKKNEIINKVKL